MKNRFNINESEKNRIRILHGMKVINEVSELGVDLETELDVDLSNVSQNESDWEKDNWDELDDEQKEVYRTHSEFKDLEEDEVKEKYNNMEKGPLRDIIKSIVSWFRRLIGKDEDEDEYVRTPMTDTHPLKKIEGEIFSGVGEGDFLSLAETLAEADALMNAWKAAGLPEDKFDEAYKYIPRIEVDPPTRKEKKQQNRKIDSETREEIGWYDPGLYLITRYYEIG